MLNSRLFCVALLLASSLAFPSRPGSCNSPPFDPTSNHMTNFKGGTELSDYGLQVSIGGNILSPSVTANVQTGKDFQVKLTSVPGQPYRGFLIKMYKSGHDLTDWLDYSPKDFLVIQNLLTCNKLKAASLGHHAADAKTSSIGSLNADEDIQDIIMEVTVVVNNSYTIPNSGSEWYASTFKINTFTPSSNTGTFCFPGDATVEVLGKGAVPMHNLTLGENVLVEGDKYEPIYSFGHSDAKVTTDYVQLTTKSTKLTLSEDHMLFVNGSRAIPASNVQVGDNIVLASGEAEPVKSIDYVIRQGAYAPFTASGSIVVNGVKASSYVSYQESEYLKIAGMSTGISYQWLAHTFELPHRMWCNLSSTACKRESYTEHGVSTWVAVPHMMMQWLISQNAVVMALVCIPVLVVLVGLWIAMACPLTVVALFVGAKVYSTGRLTRKVV